MKKLFVIFFLISLNFCLFANEVIDEKIIDGETKTVYKLEETNTGAIVTIGVVNKDKTSTVLQIYSDARDIIYKFYIKNVVHKYIALTRSDVEKLAIALDAEKEVDYPYGYEMIWYTAILLK